MSVNTLLCDTLALAKSNKIANTQPSCEEILSKLQAERVMKKRTFLTSVQLFTSKPQAPSAPSRPTPDQATPGRQIRANFRLFV